MNSIYLTYEANKKAHIHSSGLEMEEGLTSSLVELDGVCANRTVLRPVLRGLSASKDKYY